MNGSGGGAKESGFVYASTVLQVKNDNWQHTRLIIFKRIRLKKLSFYMWLVPQKQSFTNAKTDGNRAVDDCYDRLGPFDKFGL